MNAGMRWLGAGLLTALLGGCGGEKQTPTQAPPPAPNQPVTLSMPDPENYPQTTPELALDSVIKSLREKRMDYFLSHLVTPDVRQRILTVNNFDLNAAAKKQLANTANIESSLKQLELFKSSGSYKYGKLGEPVVVDGKTTEKYMLYLAVFTRPDTKEVLQFERIQNRWCFNSGVRVLNENIRPWDGIDAAPTEQAAPAGQGDAQPDAPKPEESKEATTEGAEAKPAQPPAQTEE